MRQVFLVLKNQATLSFEERDGLPVSEKLMMELTERFSNQVQINESLEWHVSAEAALLFLNEFYARYELSQPQRRIRKRAEQILSQTRSDETVRFVAADVSEHRSRRHSNSGLKKTEQSC